MDRALLDQLLPIFVAEARESVATLAQEVVALEAAPSEESRARLLRTAHGLKGSAATLGLEDIGKLAHAIESAAEAAANARLARPVVAAAMRALAAIETAVVSLEQGGEGEIGELESLSAALLPGAIPELAPQSPRPAEGVEPGSVDDPWVVFAPGFLQDVQELVALAAGALGREDRATLTQRAGAVERAASVFGLTATAQAAGELAVLAPDDGREAVRAQSQRLREAFVRDDTARQGSAAPSPSAPPPATEVPPSLRATFGVEAAEILESIFGQLPAAGSAEEATALQAATEIRRHTHRLRGITGAAGSPAIAQQAELLHQAAGGLKAATGESRKAAAAALSLELETLRQALQPGAAPASAPAVPVPGEAPRRGEGETGRSIRVSSVPLDRLVGQVEELTQASGRQGGRTRRVGRVADELTALAHLLEEALSALRAADLPGPAGPVASALGGLRSAAGKLGGLVREASRDVDGQRILTTQVKEGLRELRTVAAAELLATVEVAARDVASRLQKRVRIELTGHGVRIDRGMINSLREPLVHLVRNALDHGVESPALRRAAGKPEEAVLSLRVEARGSRLAMVVSDDGAGLDTVKIRETAVRRGLLSPSEVTSMTERQIQALIFAPGFTTTQTVTEVSGRGVGMDAVLHAVRALGGEVETESVPGQGTTFTLDLPQTIGAELCVLVRAGSQRFAVPQGKVGRLLRLKGGEVGTVAGQPVATVDGVTLPFARLSRMLGSAPGRDTGPALLLSTPLGSAVLAVEELLGQEELVVHSLGNHVGASRWYSGGALHADGELVPVLQVSALLNALGTATEQPSSRLPQLLVVDDTVTTRLALKSVLEGSGYTVVAAGGAEQALRLLEGGGFQALVTDVQMPGMDGLELLRRVRSHARLASLPVVVLTALESPDERRAGLEAGADAYVIKQQAEHQLLDAVRRLLPEVAG